MAPKTSVVLTAVENLERAEILCAVLCDCGFDAYVVDGHTAGMLWHITQAISPQGIRIAVPADQAERAWEALQELQSENLSLKSAMPDSLDADREFFRPEELLGTADYHALKASQCALFSFLFLPLIVMTPYHLLKAWGAAAKEKPQSRRYGFRICVSLIVLLFWILLFFVIGLKLGGVFNSVDLSGAKIRYYD